MYIVLNLILLFFIFLITLFLGIFYEFENAVNLFYYMLNKILSCLKFILLIRITMRNK